MAYVVFKGPLAFKISKMAQQNIFQMHFSEGP